MFVLMLERKLLSRRTCTKVTGEPKRTTEPVTRRMSFRTPVRTIRLPQHCEFVIPAHWIHAQDRKTTQRTGEGQHERARATDQEHDADVEAQRDAAVEDERDDSDAREHLFERRPAFEDGDEEGIEARADLFNSRGSGASVRELCSRYRLMIR